MPLAAHNKSNEIFGSHLHFTDDLQSAFAFPMHSQQSSCFFLHDVTNNKMQRMPEA
jgi:hypothetical protein